MNAWAAAFCGLFEARTGIRLGTAVRERLDGVLLARTAARGFAGPETYVQWLASAEGQGELQNLIDLVTVTKTSFHRHPEQVAALTTHIVPALHRRLAAGEPLRVWSAACATGQEPYTLAMALADSGWLDRRPTEIMGSDINSVALATARAARYPTAAAAQLPARWQQFLLAEGGQRVVHPSLRQRVRFTQLNLTRDGLPHPAGGWHVIVCANVLIYFGREIVRDLIVRLRQVMAQHSVLLLGATETLAAFDVGLTPVRIGDAYAYAHGGFVGFGDEPPPGGPQNEKKTRKAAPRPPGAPARPDPTRTAAEEPNPKSPHERALALAEKGARAEAITLLVEALTAEPKPPTSLRLLARLLFDERRFAEAIDVFGEVIEVEPFAFDAHFYQGWLSCHVFGDSETAREAFRRALFLEPDFAFARFEFALTLHQTGELRAAVREYERAEAASADPRVRARLKEREAGLADPLWQHDALLVEMCRAQRDLALKGLPPRSGSLSGRGG